MIGFPWVIMQPIGWSGSPRRFLFWTWTAYRVRCRNLFTGEVRYLPCDPDTLRNNAYD